jgi:hypothetical protein
MRSFARCRRQSWSRKPAGIDVIRDASCIGAPTTCTRPNAMLNHFWQKIPVFQGVTRPKPIATHDPNVTHPAAICKGPIVDTTDLGPVEEFRTASAFAHRPVSQTAKGGGEGGIRTLGPPQGGQRFSRPPRSTAPAPLPSERGQGISTIPLGTTREQTGSLAADWNAAHLQGCQPQREREGSFSIACRRCSASARASSAGRSSVIIP